MFPEWLDLTFNRYLSKPDDLYSGKIFGPEKVAPSEFFGATDKFNEHNHNKIKAKYSTERQVKVIKNAVFKSLYGLLNDELLDFIEKEKTDARQTNYINNWSITTDNFSTYTTYNYSDNLFSLTTNSNITTSSTQLFRTYSRVSNDSLSGRMVTYTQSYSDNITISVSYNGLTADNTIITWTQPKISLDEITDSSKKVSRIKRIINREYEIKEDLLGYNLKPVKTYYTCPFCGKELKSVISGCETCKEAEIKERKVKSDGIIDNFKKSQKVLEDLIVELLELTDQSERLFTSLPEKDHLIESDGIMTSITSNDSISLTVDTRLVNGGT